MSDVFRNRSTLCVLLLIGLLTCPHAALAAPGRNNQPNPDLTNGGKPFADATHDWHMGATGARGWMYSQRMVTTPARQVYITRVAKGSPADGQLQKGDVILGVDGKKFSYDPRTEIGKALTKAESAAGGGRFSLIRWRAGKTETVRLKLPVLGSYSATAPYNCPKSKRIFEQGCAALAEEMAKPGYRRNPTERSLNALALLASGNEDYMPLIEREAQWAASFKADGFATWWYGYALMLLAEYQMHTGDDRYMDGLERIALEAASGQSIVGSWGHKFAGPDGRLLGYGMMNAPGLTLTTGLVLAREAGVDDPKLDHAIAQSVKLLRFYAGKGAIPYGDHTPWIQTHDDNGKNSMAAVLFNLLGDKQAATYFSHMALASHGSERDGGHTGNFWNILWALPGVAQSGPNATGAWMNEFGTWYFDSARTWEGKFVHLGPPQQKRDSYQRWDCTGAYLLSYARPLKQLRLTGKGASVVPKLSRTQAEDIVDAGRGWDNLDRNSHYDAMSDKQLVNKLTSWSPTLRERAGMALGRRNADVLPEVIKMLGSNDLHTQYGACQAIRLMRGDRSAAVEPLRKLLHAEDLWLRISAGQALAGIGGPARAAVPDMLERLAKGPDADDPRAMEQRYLCFSLFNQRGGLISRSIDGVDREKLLAAVKAGLLNEDGRARGAVASVYNQLTYEEIAPLLPAIHQAVVEPAPSGIMFASGIRTEGLRILAKHRVEEGMVAGVALFEQTWNKWGKKGRNTGILKALVAYGAHAQAIVPRLEAIAQQYENNWRPNEGRPLAQQIRDAIEKINASENKPELRNLNLPRVGQR